jgi:hypothetical protein
MDTGVFFFRMTQPGQDVVDGLQFQFDAKPAQLIYFFKALLVGYRHSVHIKIPAFRVERRSAGMSLDGLSAFSAGFRSCDPLSAHGFTHLTSSVLTGFFKMFFHFEPFEESVILDFFLQNSQGFFNIVVNNRDSNFFQKTSPLSWWI